MIRVRVLSRSPVVKAGLETMLADRFQVGDPADVVVTDEPPDLWDLETAAPVVALTDDIAQAAELIHDGARAVLPADALPDELAAAVYAAAAGLLAIPADSASVLLAPVRARAAAALSTREREVLSMIAAGLANKEIAYRLHIAESTVKFHVASLLTKLDAGTRAEAVALGIREGLIAI